ncbi:MAG: class I SAM-dependent methyltransferase [Chloroflexota bacterium]
MANLSNPLDRAGWEAIWTRGDIPARYRTLAKPEDAVVEWAQTLPAGAAILDLGCGVGRHCLYLGGLGCRMAGQDVSPSGIEQTAAACAERGISFEGKRSPITTIPWADATFDGVLSTATIHHGLRAEVDRAVAEVRRVLKPGGSFLVDLIATDRLEYQEQKDRAAQGVIQEIEPNTFLDENNMYDTDGFLPHHYFDEAETRDLLSAFEIVRLWTTQTQQGDINRWVAVATRPLSG